MFLDKQTLWLLSLLTEEYLFIEFFSSGALTNIPRN